MTPNPTIEVCVDAVASATAAERGGADRIELCSDLLAGGTTPSVGMIEAVRERVSIGLQVMIRPRGGDFHYTAEEFEVMRRDVLAARNAGANGVVLGILGDGEVVDVARTRELVEAARPLQVTFHRAFDWSDDLTRALEDVIQSRPDRVLTSAGKRTAMEALPELANLVKTAERRITIMACGGIDATNAARIIRETGVNEIHLGLRRRVPELGRAARTAIPLGVVSEDELPRFQVLEEDVRKLRLAVDGA